MEAAIPLDVKSDPQPLPSLPSSPAPTVEEDLSEVAHTTAEQEEHSDAETTPTKTRDKGKSRAVDQDNPEISESDDAQVADAYPPTHEDEAETRRVQENLRRWEMAERQRRKAARETNQPPAKSLVSDVTRRASLLWTGRKSQHVSRPSRNDRGLGTHAALQSQDSVDVVPLGDIETAGVDSPSTSPLPGQHSVNPFDHPSDPVSPFADQSAVMDASSNPPTPSAQIDNTKQNTPKRPTLMQSSSSLGPPPTPKPLDLPPPRTPPPPNGQLQPTPSPSVSPPPNEERGEPKPTRWWHDWLCGLSEGDDRGGDDQAGRTNPME